ncbi:MAG: AsmA family protein, partial [Hyphomicrobiaceae bacterium]
MTSSAPVRPPLRPKTEVRNRKTRSSAGIVEWLAYGTLALAALVAAAGAVLIAMSPVQLVRDRFERQVLARTGRVLTIGGTSVSFAPAFTVTLSDVSLSAPSGMAGGPAVRIPALEAQVALWPLLKRRVKVERLKLVRPEIELRIDGQGRRNWETAERRAQPAPSERGAAKRAAAEPRTRTTPEKGAHALDDVRIEQGTVRYVDERAGTTREFTAFDVHISLASLESPLIARGSTSYGGETVSFTAEVQSPDRVLAAESAHLTATLSSRLGTAAFEGDILA